MAVARDISDVAGLDQALAEIVEQAALLTEADVVVARLRSDGAGLTARAVHASSAALQAELEGSRISADSLSADGADDLVQLSRPLRLVADKLGATAVLQLPIRVGDTLIGSLELMRRRGAFDDRERALAHTAAGQVALARRAFGEGADLRGSPPDPLELAGDALAAGSDEARTADQVAALAGEATGATGLPPLALRDRGAGDGGALGADGHCRAGGCTRRPSAGARLDRSDLERAARGPARRRFARHPPARPASSRGAPARLRG